MTGGMSHQIIEFAGHCTSVEFAKTNKVLLRDSVVLLIFRTLGASTISVTLFDSLQHSLRLFCSVSLFRLYSPAFKMWLLRVFMPLFALLVTTTAQLTDAATMSASIRSEAGYSLLPGCVNQCIWDIGGADTYDIGGDLADHLSCSRPYPNGCYCRGASATVAYSFLTECFNFLCTTPAASDIDSGISIYTSYCSAALGAAYTPDADPEPAPADGSSVAATAAPTAGSGLYSAWMLQIQSDTNMGRPLFVTAKRDRESRFHIPDGKRERHRSPQRRWEDHGSQPWSLHRNCDFVLVFSFGVGVWYWIQGLQA
jgi:hypothetical protein